MAPRVLGAFLLSALTARAAPSECPSGSEGAACDSLYLLQKDAVIVGGAADELEPFTIPPNCECTCSPTAAPTPEVDIKDDPHIRNLAQESFAVNQPGEYTLLRVPQDPEQDALLEIRGTIGRHDASACKMYTMGVSLSGKWLGNRAVFVRPLQRGSAGSNAAAGEEKWPLSLLVSEKGSHEWPRAGTWTNFEDFRAASKPDRGHSFPETFKIVAFRDQAFGEMREGETFQFQVGPGPKWEQKAKINVAQASHQALNLALQQVKRLGAMHIGGLLGTEAHEPSIERLTQECMMERAAHVTIPDRMSLFSTSASMTDTRPSVIYSWWH